MTSVDPKTAANDLRDGVLAGIQSVFPIKDRAGKLEVRARDFKAEDTLDADDIKEQMRHRMEGRTWSVPVHATVDVVDTESGKTLISRKMLLARIPKITRHYSFIVNGQEKSITNQWRLRPGPFVKPMAKPGKFEAQFQLAKGKSFDIQTDDSGALIMGLGSREIPLYSIMQAHGYSDDAMEKAWGADTYAASKAKAKPERNLKSFLEGWTKKPGTGTPVEQMKALLAETQMDPEVVSANLGIHSAVVTGDVLFAASKKLLDVTAGKTPHDPIDSLRYKELWQPKDQLVDRLTKSTGEIHRRVQKQLGKKSVQDRLLAKDPTALRDIVMPDLINRPIHFVFNATLAATGKQTNLLAMLADHSMVTITGPGGIENPHAITASNTAIDPSHLGFLDPVFTPESEAGKNVHLSYGTRVVNKRPVAKLYSIKEQKIVDVDTVRAAVSNIVLPDQVTWKDGHPTPREKVVRISDKQGEMQDLPWHHADYVMLSPTQVFATETNLVPFMGNNSAGRTTMSARHMSQAISIEGREAPLVQVEAGGGRTFEQILGSTFLAMKSPVAGTVTRVKSDEVTIKDAQGKLHVAPLYHHYPTNDPKGMLHATPLVKAGDQVTAGQLLADNNYSKNGVLALGTNLRTAYLANGLNHEDGIVLSESARHKLRSTHLYKPSVYVSDSAIVGRKAFSVARDGTYSMDRIEKIGEDGVIKIGEIVKPGDPLVLMLNHSADVTDIDASARTKIGKQMRSRKTNGSLVWDADYTGEVVGVSRKGSSIEVHIKTLEPAQIGSKISTRHAAKGIVTAVMPDNEMPKNAKGEHVEMMLNPVSVPGRLNAGQLLETAAGKIAEKTGKPYVVKNFRPGVDYLKELQTELKHHGLSDTEALFDPKTGRKIGDIMVGPHYAMQLEHQIDKKTHARSGGVSLAQSETPMLAYDKDTLIPQGGGHSGAQSLGSLGLYAALAGGLHANISEMQTLKSDQKQAIEAYKAITAGLSLPAPKIPWAARKFEALMGGLGINVKNTGNEIRIMPRSDAETRAVSHGALTNAALAIRVRDDKEEPVKGGIFDAHATGGPGGHRWSHIELEEPLPHPLFAKPIAVALGINERDIVDIIGGTKKLPNGGVGGAAFKKALAEIDVDKSLADLRAKIKDPKVREGVLNKYNAQYHAMEVLKELKLHPKDAWTIQAVPVIPPTFRPLVTADDGTIRNNPLNALYRRLGLANDSLKHGKGLPYNSTLDTRAGLYKELSYLMGTTSKSDKAKDLDMRGTREDPNKTLPGILHMISGETPKDGYFQKKMTGKRMDYTARVTLVADPTLSTDEIGVPKKVAMELYRPMVVRRLIANGHPPEEAHLMASRKDPVAVRALEQEIKYRPLLMKRDPVLHQYGIVGQNVILTDSKAIKISPLVMPPLNADVDGDQVSLMVPLSHQAVDEVRRATPSQRPLADASGEVFYTPANESALSLYRMSIPRGAHGGVHENREAAERAFASEKINLNSPIHMKGVGETTLGRVRVAEVIPETYRKSVLTDLTKPFDKKSQAKVLDDAARHHKNSFVSSADGLSRLGFRMAYESGHTVSLKDLEPLRAQRDAIVAAAQGDVDKMRVRGESAAPITERWLEATRGLHAAYKKQHEIAPTNVSDMAAAGVKAKTEQFQGLVMAPMLVEDHLGRPSQVPIKKSFAEGIDVGGYFMQAAGARRGVIQKTQAVRDPGYMTKLLMQVSLDQPVTVQDCGTTHGISMPIGDRDVIDRHLAQALKIGTATVPSGTPVTAELLAKAKEARIDNFMVRSPLKCRAPRGVCSVCMGLHPTGQHWKVGENAGIISAQALGERGAQIMLRQTHGGGIVSTGSAKLVDEFKDVQRLFDAAKPSDIDAAVAMTAEPVKKISRGNDGIWNIWLGDRSKALRTSHEPFAHVKPGYTPTKGEILSRGDPNPHHLAETTGLESAQAYMAKKIGDIFAREGVLRRHAELTVRNATSAVMIDDPGHHLGFVRGDYTTKPAVDELNRLNPGKAPIKYTPHLAAIAQIPRYSSKDWIAGLQGEDLAQTIRTGAQHGHTSRLDGPNPIPGIAFGQHRPTAH